MGRFMYGRFCRVHFNYICINVLQPRTVLKYLCTTLPLCIYFPGQELTARTHHVGETRKRVVPVELSQSVPQHLLPVKLLSGMYSC